jgi:peroxiredoxin
MKRLPLFISAFAIALLPVLANAVATPGQPAPDFKATDSNGKPVSLSSFKGKHVVLEWVNPECPFVKKHYGSGNMQGLQKNYTGKDVVWLAVSTGESKSAAPGLNAWLKEMNSAPTTLVMDSDTRIGQLYGAKTTPHMYIIDPQGKLVYAGAIDDKRGTNPDEIKTAKNFVKAALDETLAGKTVTTASTPPYGCKVKY